MIEGMSGIGYCCGTCSLQILLLAVRLCGGAARDAILRHFSWWDDVRLCEVQLQFTSDVQTGIW